ncbi:hypothetical protein GIB67_042414, partial [Kingdonia uniflora]
FGVGLISRVWVYCHFLKLIGCLLFLVFCLPFCRFLLVFRVGFPQDSGLPSGEFYLP